MSPAEASVIQFPQLCDNCHCTEKACRCDAWIGCCTSCGSEVYGGDEHRIEAGRPICSECIAEERTWKVDVYEVAA